MFFIGAINFSTKWYFLPLSSRDHFVLHKGRWDAANTLDVPCDLILAANGRVEKSGLMLAKNWWMGAGGWSCGGGGPAACQYWFPWCIFAKSHVKLMVYGGGNSENSVPIKSLARAQNASGGSQCRFSKKPLSPLERVHFRFYILGPGDGPVFTQLATIFKLFSVWL